jgi:hypothetical protein
VINTIHQAQGSKDLICFGGLGHPGGTSGYYYSTEPDGQALPIIWSYPQCVLVEEAYWWRDGISADSSANDLVTQFSFVADKAKPYQAQGKGRWVVAAQAFREMSGTNHYRYPTQDEQRYECVLAIAFGTEGCIAAWLFDATMFNPITNGQYQPDPGNYEGLFMWDDQGNAGATAQRSIVKNAFQRAEFLYSKIGGKWQQWTHHNNLPGGENPNPWPFGWLYKVTLTQGTGQVVCTRFEFPGGVEFYPLVNKSTTEDKTITVTFDRQVRWSVSGKDGGTDTIYGIGTSTPAFGLLKGDGVVVRAEYPP